MKLAQTTKIKMTALAFAVLVVVAACGNKNSDSQPVPTTLVNPQCLGCGGITGAAFFHAESQDWYGTVKFNWSFSGQAQLQPQYQQPYQNGQYNQQPYGQPYNQQYGQPGIGYQGGYNYQQSYNNNNNVGSPIINYSGPVAAQGIMTILQGMNLGYCQLPQGTYNLSTVAPGQWNSAIVTGLRLQANGPGGTIILSVPTGQVSAKTGSQLGSTYSEVAPVGRLFANVLIEAVNGYQCGTSILVQ